MMIRPKGEQLEIAYSMEFTETWESYIQTLNNFLSRECHANNLKCIPHRNCRNHFTSEILYANVMLLLLCSVQRHSPGPEEL